MKIGNKGTTLDVIFIFILLLGFGITILVSTYLADQIFPMLTGFFGPTSQATSIVDTTAAGYGAFDNIFMFLFFMLNMIPVIAAVLVKHHPIFLIINILVLVIWLLIAPAMSNVMLEFWEMEEFAQYAIGGGGSRTYSVMTRLFQYGPYLSVGLSIILMVAMFVKSPSGGVSM